MGRFPEALKLFEKINEEADAANGSGEGALRTPHQYNATVFISEEQYVLLFIEAAAAQTKKKRHGQPFSGHVFYSYAEALLEKLQMVRQSSVQVKTSSFDEYLSTEIPQTKSFLLSVKNMFVNTMSLFS